MPKRVKINIGEKFFRLTVVEFMGAINMHYTYNCVCDCGKNILVRGSALLSKNTKSCGCLNKQKGKNILLGYNIGMDFTKDSNGKRTSEYCCYLKMKSRCYCVNNAKYKNYGERGIKVCDRWVNSYENFIKDMGLKPSKDYSIERIDVNGNYEPSNCKWGTLLEQASNKTNTVRIEINGSQVCQSELARICKVHDHSISYQLSKGKSGNEIISYYKNKKNANLIQPSCR